MAYFNTDNTGGVEQLNAYLASIDGTKKPISCPWLRELPEELVTQVLDKRETHPKGTLYCTELKAPCQVKGQIMKAVPDETGKPRICIACACHHQIVASLESFLQVKWGEDVYRKLTT